MKKNIIKGLLILVVSFLAFYFLLPAINLTDPNFYFFVIVLFTVCCVIVKVVDTFNLDFRNLMKYNKYHRFDLPLWGWGIIGFIPVLLIGMNIVLSPLFNAKSYYRRINVSNGDFKKDVELVDFNKLALLDKNSSRKLGDKVMGQMPNLVSQFEVSPLYTQVNYRGDLLRVTPLEYSNFIKYLTNRKEGIKGFITVNSISGDAKLSKLDKGMKIMPSAYFFENLFRALRFKYPTAIFGDFSFEVDEDGNPYWVVEVLKYSGIGLKKDIDGVIILDPITGKSTRYKSKDVPKWVDRVYSPSIVLEQLDSWGKYKNGYLNSVFGQKDVIRTTAGYNYLLMNDDIYMYTGITSVLSDEANIGFVLTNLRTKETKFYDEAGTNEISAMASAEGQVQQMKYTSTFPLLINLDNRPTYLVSLKDKAGLVKMYAFIDYVDYQRVVVTDSSEGILKAAENYLSGQPIDETSKKTKDITVKDFKTAVIDGNTYYYILTTDSEYYRVKFKNNEDILLNLADGDSYNITYKNGKINYIVKFNR